MALSAGSVTVDDDGVRSGSGLARDLYDAERGALYPVDLNNPAALPDSYKVHAWLAYAREFAPEHVSNLDGLSSGQKATAEASYLADTWKPQVVEYILRPLATKVTATAAAIVSHLASNADVRVPQDSLDTGIPSTTRVLSGALE